MKIDVKKIKAWLDAKGMSRYQLAIRAGLSGYVLYRVLKSGRISEQHLKSLAMAMGMSVESLTIG